MTPAVSLIVIVLVCVCTVVAGVHGVRLTRTTSDFYAAGRTLSPWRTASAVGGDYLSAASFLGIAGLVYSSGVSMLWFPAGYTLGHVLLAALVAAPLRRSGAYTIPDFAHLRLKNSGVRSLTAALVVCVGWLYLMAQLQGAELVVDALTGAPPWIGSLLVAAVTVAVVSGGMRSVTDLQVGQYWVKLATIAVPAVALLATWALSDSRPLDLAATATAAPDTAWIGYETASLLLALTLGTMGMPHVGMRLYTSRDGRAARRTTVPVVALLGLFYLFPPIYAALGRTWLPTPPPGTRPDQVMFALPRLVLGGTAGEFLLALLVVGAFSAVLSASCGMAVALTGVLDQDLVRPHLRHRFGDVGGAWSFRLSAALSVTAPFVLSFVTHRIGLATTVGLAFAVAASTLCPLLVLGTWWRRLTARGIALGMAVGAAASLTAVTVTLTGIPVPHPADRLLAQPAAWTAPLAFATAMIASLATGDRIPSSTLRTMTRLHAPEHLRDRRRA